MELEELEVRILDQACALRTGRFLGMELFSRLPGSTVVRPGPGRHFTPDEDGGSPLAGAVL
jgi:hypothetical protein